MLTIRNGATLLAMLLAASSAASGQEEEPSPTRVIERARVELVILDVEVVDRKGRPLRGLAPGDFQLRLDSRDWPVYSVDDLCREPLPEVTAAESSAAAEVPDAPGETEAPGAAAPRDPSRPRFVIYFDFSELRMEGRARALKAARRWVASAMQPGDEAMVIGYLSQGGLKELCPFTSDADRILAVIDAAKDDMSLVESFPSERGSRMSECHRCLSDKVICSACARMDIPCSYCCPMCGGSARQEHLHDQRSMTALKELLTSLEGVEGRKAVLFFYQNTSISPGVFYGMPAREYDVSNLGQTLEEVGAEATTVRATVNPVQTAGGQFGAGGPAVDLAVDLANYTGGRYNRSLSDIDRALADVARDEHCVYRIAFEPPEASRSKIYRVEVRAKVADIPFEYRVQHLIEADRNLRKARSVLSRPGSASDLDVRAAILPLRFEGGKWELGVQVVVDVSSIGLLPVQDGQAIDLDVGGLFYEITSGKNWELLTGSSLRSASKEELEGDVVYARTMRNLPPGRYRLTVFARNRQLNLYGGASRDLTVPGKEVATLLGPFALLPDKSHVLVHLPLKEQAKEEEGRHSLARKGPVWAGERSVEPGESLDIVTWLCPDGSEPDSALPTRFLSRDDVPLYRLPEPRVEDQGDCTAVTDSIDTSALAGGSYTYRIAWTPKDGPPLAGELTFSVASLEPW